MAILTSHEIRARVATGDISVTPYDEKSVQQNSLDVRLGKGVCVYSDTVIQTRDLVTNKINSKYTSRTIRPNEFGLLDVKIDNPVIRFDMDDSGWIIKPGVLYLMHVEEILCAPHLVMTLDGRSSYARLGVIVHYTAGHAETGFHGQFTLEVSALHPVIVYPGIPIAQVIFQTVEGEIEDYRKRGNYVGQAALGAQPSRSWKHFAQSPP